MKIIYIKVENGISLSALFMVQVLVFRMRPCHRMTELAMQISVVDIPCLLLCVRNVAEDCIDTVVRS